MTILGFFWFLVAMVGTFIIGFMCGKHDAHRHALGHDQDGPGDHGADHSH